MLDFYKGLKEGNSIDQALKNAKQKYLHEIGHPQYSHPFFWASFIPIGNMDAVNLKQDNNHLSPILFSLLAGLILFIGIIIYKKRREQNQNKANSSF